MMDQDRFPSPVDANSNHKDAPILTEDTRASATAGGEESAKNLLAGIKVICERMIRQIQSENLADIRHPLEDAVAKINVRLRG